MPRKRFGPLLASVLALTALLGAPPVGVPRAKAQVVAGPITFSEFPAGTPITTQYADRGVVFGGDAPFIAADGSSPTSPVLSGSPLFRGSIEIRVVSVVDGSPSEAQGISLDVGFIDNPNSVEISSFALSGVPLGSVRANAAGINHIELPLRGLHRVTVAAVESEPAGFAIDNVAINSSVAVGVSPQRMVMFGDSFSSGEGLLPEPGLFYDCGTDDTNGFFYENTNITTRFSVIGGSTLFVRSGPPCDTTTQQPITFEAATRRPLVWYDNGCHRHRKAWPNQVRNELGLDPLNGLFVACSGATTENIGLLESGNRIQNPDSPNGVAGGQLQITNALDFARPPALPVDFITIGVGGNDAGFVPIIWWCLAWPDCSEKPNFVDDILTKINGEVYDKVLRTFQRLKLDFPEATILTYGYPSIFQFGMDSDCAGTSGLNENERRFAQERMIPALNQAIEDAAVTAGITFMPIFNVTNGHEICSVDPWINGQRSGIWESLHPNQKAHDAIARFFLDHYTDGNGRLTFANPVPNPTIRVPGQPITLNVGNVRAAPLGGCGIECIQPACSIAACQLGVQLNGFAPHTTLHVVLNSDPIVLGDLVSDEFGTADAVFDLPPGVAAGEHTLEITGESPDGVEQLSFTRVVIEQLEAPVVVVPGEPPNRSGYWMVGADGTVYAFGDAAHLGNANVGSAETVDLESTPSGNGYWIVDDHGRVYAYGDAVTRGNVDPARLVPGERVTSLSATTSGNGYWVFTSRGGVLTFGDAVLYGDMSAVRLNGDVLDSIPTATGNGYYMVASDGGIFSFGDAVFYGSMGAEILNAPVQSLVPDADGVGYWLVASDGGIFAFEAPFSGSMGATKLNKPVTGMVRFGDAYLMVGEDGGIFNFSNKLFLGSLGANPPARSIVSVAVLER